MRDPGFISAPDDAALAREVAAAHPERVPAAEAELCRRLAPRIRLYGLRHLRDPHEASDLVQNVLVMVLERLRAGKVREPGQLVSFVFGVCRRVVLELRRGASRRERLLERAGLPEEAVAPAEPDPFADERLARCLQGLAERDRLVLVMTFYGDRSADEVARSLALSPANVRVIRHRALERLRACVGGGPA